jgi:ABC-type glycerol-3-phosphate transport system substrate-binding protein
MTDSDRVGKSGVARRTLLKAATGPLLIRTGGLVTVASGLAAGCARPKSGLEVFVVWGGAELAQFRRIMDEFSKDTGNQVRIVTVGEHVQELLRARVDANNPPDIAVVSVPSVIKEYAQDGRVVELSKSLADDVPPGLRDTVTVNDKMYGVWVKVAHKSLFWYRPSALSARVLPCTWPDLVEIVRAAARSGRTPLSIGAADGWVVTDWFENVLASVDGGVTYEQLAQGKNQWESDQVRTALNSLSQIWTIPRVFPAGPKAALLTEFEESVVEVFANKRAGLLYGADFVASVVNRFQTAGRAAEPPGTFRFPAFTRCDQHNSRPLVVGGDVAALLIDSRGGRELINRLANPESFAGWIEAGGFLSPNSKFTPQRYPDRLTKELAGQLQRQAASLHFDLSDQLGGRFGGGQGRGMLRILPKFFAAATAPDADRDAAVRQAQEELAAAARQNSALSS